MEKLEKFKEFELKDASITYGGSVSRTCIYNNCGEVQGIDLYNHNTCTYYDILGNVLE